MLEEGITFVCSLWSVVCILVAISRDGILLVLVLLIIIIILPVLILVLGLVIDNSGIVYSPTGSPTDCKLLS